MKTFIKNLAKKYKVECRSNEKIGAFTVWGNPTEIAEAKKALEDGLTEKELNIRRGDSGESSVRLKTQDIIDNNNLKASILLDGNTVYGFNSIMKDFDRIIKGGVEKLTKKLYRFFHLNFTIANYDINGWIKTYPTLADVLEVLQKNKAWADDVRKIQDAMIAKLKDAAPKEKTNIVRFKK